MGEDIQSCSCHRSIHWEKNCILLIILKHIHTHKHKHTHTLTHTFRLNTHICKLTNMSLARTGAVYKDLIISGKWRSNQYSNFSVSWIKWGDFIQSCSSEWTLRNNQGIHWEKMHFIDNFDPPHTHTHTHTHTHKLTHTFTHICKLTNMSLTRTGAVLMDLLKSGK